MQSPYWAESTFFQSSRYLLFSAVLLESMFIELCTTCSSLHVCIRGCLSCFWDLRFLGELRPFALINGYCECLEHAHQFVRYGCFLVPGCFVRYGYNSLKRILLLCYCVARDTHFSAFIVYL